jgi:hypothetical protein
MRVTTIDILAPVRPHGPTPCEDCVRAYGAVAETAPPQVELPVIAQATCVWPDEVVPRQLCGHHAYVRSQRLATWLTATTSAAVAS